MEDDMLPPLAVRGPPSPSTAGGLSRAQPNRRPKSDELLAGYANSS